MKWFVGLILLWMLASCQPANSSLEADARYFEMGVSLGKVDEVLAEASGLTASVANPNRLWTHNDSGNTAELFLIDQKGKVVMTCELAGVTNRDWEDIAMGPGPDSTKSYLYVGDIGDNRARHRYKVIYRLEEPMFSSARDVIHDFDTLYVELEDGARDSESLMVDPRTNILYLVSKREDAVRVYDVGPFPDRCDTVTARAQATLPFHDINGGDISADGSEILLRNYYNVVYWQRGDSLSVPEALTKAATVLPYAREAQGEAIAFARDGSGYYTLSESTRGIRADLRFYKRK